MTVEISFSAFIYFINKYGQPITIILSVLHLLILSISKQRANFVNILMIAIAISDTLNFSILYWKYWGNENNIPQFIIDLLTFPLFLNPCVVYLHLLKETDAEHWMLMSLQDSFRRTSVLLSMIIALYRTFYIKFPMSKMMQHLSKPGIAMVLVVLNLVVWFVVTYSSLEVIAAQMEERNQLCGGLFTIYLEMYRNGAALVITPSSKAKSTIIIEAAFKSTPSLLYPIISCFLIIELKRIRKKRQTLRSQQKEHFDTTMLIFIMTVLFAISEGFTGASTIIWLLNAFDPNERSYFLSSDHWIGTLRIMNTFSHPFVCFSMSSQYRETVKKLFPIKKTSTVRTAAAMTVNTINRTTSN